MRTTKTSSFLMGSAGLMIFYMLAWMKITEEQLEALSGRSAKPVLLSLCSRSTGVERFAD